MLHDSALFSRLILIFTLAILTRRYHSVPFRWHRGVPECVRSILHSGGATRTVGTVAGKMLPRKRTNSHTREKTHALGRNTWSALNILWMTTHQPIRGNLGTLCWQNLVIHGSYLISINSHSVAGLSYSISTHFHFARIGALILTKK